jgi:hypothetical protein
MTIGTDQILAVLPGACALAQDMTSEFSRLLVAATFRNPRLLQYQLTTHSRSETDGSEFLLEVANLARNPQLRSQLHDHAMDEAKHGRIYTALSERAKEVWLLSDFCGNEGRRDESREAFNGSMVRFFMSLHVAEIRNRLLLDVYLDEIGAIDDKSMRARMYAAIGKIRDDEVRHVNYTLPFVIHGLAAASIALEDVDKAFSMFRSLYWTEASETLRMAATLVTSELPSEGGVEAAFPEDSAVPTQSPWLVLIFSSLNADAVRLIALCKPSSGNAEQPQDPSRPGTVRAAGARVDLDAGFAAIRNLIWNHGNTDCTANKRAALETVAQYFPQEHPSPADMRRIQSFARSLWVDLANATQRFAGEC